jgi:hypothetical protein
MKRIEEMGYGRERWAMTRDHSMAGHLKTMFPFDVEAERNELMEKVLLILESGTSHATTFALNIETFYKAVIGDLSERT